MKAFRLNEKFKITIGDVVFHASPLTFEERTAVQQEILKAERNADPLGLVRAAKLAMKFSIKEQKGITYHDGEEMELEFDGQGHLADKTVDELLLADSDEQLKLVCMTMAKGIPTVPLDENKKPIKGIKVENPGKKPGKK